MIADQQSSQEAGYSSDTSRCWEPEVWIISIKIQKEHDRAKSKKWEEYHIEANEALFEWLDPHSYVF